MKKIALLLSLLLKRRIVPPLVRKNLIGVVMLCFFTLSGCSSYDNYDSLHIENSAFAAFGGDEVAKAAPPSFDNPNNKTVYNNMVVGEFGTKYNQHNTNRSHNISLAVGILNGTIVMPGETFSYNDTIGPSTKEKGYKLATVFKQGKEYKGYGGGICQVSTTLFNACENGGLETIERHNHSMAVHYVEKGQDAATSYGGVDYKFKNNKRYPIVINATANEGKLNITLRAKVNIQNNINSLSAF